MPDINPTPTTLDQSMRSVSEALVSAFNRNDIDAIMALRNSNCTNQLLPSSIGAREANNQQYKRRLQWATSKLTDYAVVVQDSTYDVANRKAWLRLCATAQATPAGKAELDGNGQPGAVDAEGRYRSDYIWILTFSRDGQKLDRFEEFVGWTGFRLSG